MKELGFIAPLLQDINELSSDEKYKLNNTSSLTLAKLVDLVSKPENQSIVRIDEPSLEDATIYDCDKVELGIEAILNGKVAVCIICDENKPFIKIDGVSLLMMKLLPLVNQRDVLTILMTSDSYIDLLQAHVRELTLPCLTPSVIFQHEMLGLTPDNRISKPKQFVQTGSGDVPLALIDSGVMHAFEKLGIEYVVFSDIDNVSPGSTLDPGLIGHHIVGQKNATFAVTQRDLNEDVDSALVFADGKKQILDVNTLSEFDHEAKILNTGTCVVNVETLVSSVSKDWNWYRKRKIKNNNLIVFYKRFLHQLTEFYDCEFVLTNRLDHFVKVEENNIQLYENLITSINSTTNV